MNKNRQSAYRNALSELFGELFSGNDLISIPEPDEGIDAALEFTEEVTRYDESMWATFLNGLKLDTAKIQASYSSEGKLLTLQLSQDFFTPPFYNDLQIRFCLETFPAVKPEDFEYGELYGMSRDEAIAYLSQLVENSDDDTVPEVEYLHISSSSFFVPFDLYAAVKPLPDTKEMTSLINHVTETLLKIPEVLAKVDEEIKAKEEEEKKKEAGIKEIEDLFRPILIDAGWEGEFCVIHFTKDLYKLYLRVGVKTVSVCATVNNILDRIPNLVQISKAYMGWMTQLSELGKEGFAFGQSYKNFHWHK